MTLSRQSPRASISSPGFPRHYPDNADCDTTIVAPKGFRVVLDFDELVIENEPRFVATLLWIVVGKCSISCSYDYLEIIEETSNGSVANTSRRICGDWSMKLKLLRYVSHGSRLVLRFSSDYSHHYGGYKARVSMKNGTKKHQTRVCKWCNVNIIPAMQCGDERLQMFNDGCYLVVSYPEVTWPTAQQICRGIKALLASVNSVEEERFITSTIRKSPEYRTSALYW